VPHENVTPGPPYQRDSIMCVTSLKKKILFNCSSFIQLLNTWLDLGQDTWVNIYACSDQFACLIIQRNGWVEKYWQLTCWETLGVLISTLDIIVNCLYLFLKSKTETWCTVKGPQKSILRQFLVNFIFNLKTDFAPSLDKLFFDCMHVSYSK